MISQETFETPIGHKTHILVGKSGLIFILGVDLQLQLQLQHETLKLVLKLKLGSEEKYEIGFKNFIKFHAELLTLISLLGTTQWYYGYLKSRSRSCVVDIMIWD